LDIQTSQVSAARRGWWDDIMFQAFELNVDNEPTSKH